jgi:glycosyltransferase involved in cell wall biosynthesis
MSERAVSVIIPARNEEALIGRVLEAVLCAVAHAGGGLPIHLAETEMEVIVVDNASADRTAEVVRSYSDRFGVQLVHCPQLKAPCARNFGARLARGRLHVFVDGDTVIPAHALSRIRRLCELENYEAGITRLASLEGGARARCWWAYWGLMRHLPLARAKAMPAFMFCTRSVFHEFGPFDEGVVIGEEWPILAGVYRARPQRFIYDQAITALSSSRRMELQPFGYVRTFWRYVWAVAHHSGRYRYADHHRHLPAERKRVA